MTAPPVGVAASPQEPPLIEAARQGDLRRLRELLAQGEDPDQAGPGATKRRRFTALIAACEGAHFECVQALLGAGAKTDFVSPDGRDALASALEHRQGCRLALGRAKLPSAHIVLSPQALACGELLLQAGADPSRAVGKALDKSTPLARAASWLDKPFLLLLLRFGADPNVESHVHIHWSSAGCHRVGPCPGYPLGSVLSRNAIDLAWLLFDAGADPTLKAQWEPDMQTIAQRSAGGPAIEFMREALPVHAERQAIENACAPAAPSTRKPRL